MSERMSYRDFCRDLSGVYTDKQMRHLYGAVLKCDLETVGWIIAWFTRGSTPDRSIEGIDYSYLTDKLGMKPINAFLTLDWLKRKPDEAKYFLMRYPVRSETGIDVQKLLEDMGYETKEEENPSYPDLRSE